MPQGEGTRDESDPSEPSARPASAPAALIRIGHLGRLQAEEAALFLLGDVARVDITRGAAHAARLDEGVLELEVDDPWMSALHASIEVSGPRHRPAYQIVDRGSRNGVIADGRRVASHVLRHGDMLVLGRTAFRFHGRPIAEPDEIAALSRALFGPTRSVSPMLLAELRVLARAAPSPLSVLITGETGAGKDVAARELHARSGRKGPLVAVNCAAIPESMVEAQLFGHRRGAFTGATDSSPGLVLSAEGGTLFLDEIGDMPLAAQAKLLRVLEQREVLPVGEVTVRKVDVRVVAATHADLRSAVAAGRFRKDLFARLAQITVKLPRLSDRKEDLGLLVPFFCRAARVTVSLDAARALLAHDWPLNVRELASALQAAAVLAGESRVIERAHLPEEVRGGDAAAPASTPPPEGDDDGMCPKREELDALLARHRGNVAAAARELGKGKTQIYRWLKRRGLDPESFR